MAALIVASLSAIPRDVTPVEETLFYALNRLPDALEWPLWALMQLGAAPIVPVLALLAFLVWRRLRPAVDLLLAGMVAWLLAKVMKSLIERGRPPSFFDDVDLRGSFGVGGDEGLGFPSGHAALGVAVAASVHLVMDLATDTH